VSQPVCLITGATEGVGRATALELAGRGYKVVVAARSQSKADAVRAEIETRGSGEADFIQLDLASLAQVRAAAETFDARYSRLDLLINNAGVVLSRRGETQDGLEATFQVNYLAHFLLTQLLLPKLDGRGRIVNLSSSIHSVGKFVPADLQSETRYSALGSYSASKLFMLMFTEELARRLVASGTTVNAVHPGIVRTQMMLGIPGALRVIAYLSLPFSVSPEAGARTSVYVATSPEVAGVNGAYFVNRKRASVKSKYDTPENRALLWELSWKCASTT
jgi:NAD(P)-dependent dehydrogenase (short-subunit alcohol dehydrogenase family)